ncbi:hypothetical protein HS7_21350 [Sulfolobales archaeon HS-7]|nr:hypothetical protein HS7_21350 [Sulfolobales archaeon HS-7]
MDSKLIGLIVALVVVLGIAGYGFFLYSQEASKVSSLQSSLSSITQHTVTQLVTQTQVTTVTQTQPYYITTVISPNTVSGVVFQFLDGIAIENINDTTPFLAPNFTAAVMGEPFPGYYTTGNFSSWLNNFFSTYETVYFYTTALPTVSDEQFSAVVQYFVAPTQDPVLLQVFNASFTATVSNVSGQLKITHISWMGNTLSPSAVIAGYPSQHSMQANQALEEVLYQINGMGAEFPPSTMVQSFSPSATLEVTGTLPAAVKVGNYTGIQSISSFFSEWDNFEFVAEYSQNILPNGTAIPPNVMVTLSPNMTYAVVTANETPFLVFLSSSQPGYPAICDIHIDLTAYLMYNSTTASWQIQKEVFNAQTVPVSSDAPGYVLNPTFTVYGERTATITNAEGAVLKVGNVEVIVHNGTAVKFANGTVSTNYNFSLVLFAVQGVFSPPGTNLIPMYAFGFAVNGQITPAISLVNASNTSQPMAPTTLVQAPNTWTTWTWFGGEFNGTVYTGGGYKFADHWIYGNSDMMANVVFFKPVIWIFEASQMPLGMPSPQVSITPTTVYGLTPISSYAVQVNASQGALLTLGPITVVIPPGTTATENGMTMTTYNFSIILYNESNVPSPASGQQAYLVFAYAVNNQVTPSIVLSKPLVTIIISPNEGPQMWTWLNKYVFHDPIISEDGYVINLTFFRPVPWVLTLPVQGMPATLTSTSQSTSSSSYY